METLVNTEQLDMFIFRNREMGWDSSVVAKNEEDAWSLYLDKCDIGSDKAKRSAKIEKWKIESQYVYSKPSYIMSMKRNQ